MPQENSNGSIVKIEVNHQSTQYKNIFASVAPTSVSGTGWIVDMKELLQCGIPFIGEPEKVPLAESIDATLKSLGIPQSADGKFLLIVTNAHVVHGFKSGIFKLENVAITYSVSVLITFPDRDLALLIPDEASINQLIPCNVSTTPIKPGDSIVAMGYPGTKLCTSKGDLKRILLSTYVHSGLNLLTYETTAPTNSGDSGGPVFDASGAVVAITHQHSVQGRSQSHAIPITHLVCAVRDYCHHKRDIGVLSVPIQIKAILNRHLLRFYGLETDGVGVLVTTMYDLPQTPFKSGDILLSINELPISCEGNIQYGKSGEFVAFSSYATFCLLGDQLRFKVIRDNCKIDLSVSLTTTARSHYLIPTKTPVYAPLAFYRHGLAFVQLVMGVQQGFNKSDGQNVTPSSLMKSLYANRYKTNTLQGIVYVFTMSISAEGYTQSPMVITAINEQPVRDIWHAQQILDNPKYANDEFIRVYCDGSKVPEFVLPRLTATQEEENRRHFNIPSRFFALPKSQLAQEKWQLIREKMKAGFFKPAKLSEPDMESKNALTSTIA